jgi:hypothetical protein
MSQPTIQVAVVDILKSGEGKTLIENAVKDFICKNDKIFTPVVQHIESKVDQAFSTADVNVLFDKFIQKIKPCDVKNCLTKCLDPTGANTGANTGTGATQPMGGQPMPGQQGAVGGKFNKTRKRKKGKNKK